LFDIGAFEGDMCITLTKSIVGLRSYAFEPNPTTAQRLRKRVEKAGLQKDITVIESAVSDKVGLATLKQPDVEDTAHHGLSTIGTPARFKNAQRYEVATTTLDEFIKSREIEVVDFLKIDAEGAEALILEGAFDLIALWKPAIFIEMREVNTKQFGYKPRRIYNFMFRLDYYCCSAQTGRDWYFWYKGEHAPRRGDL
jgi:FkbM family methyltransferase